MYLPTVSTPARAHGEDRITLLPFELRLMLSGGPYGGGLFEFAHKVRDAVRRFESNEGMDMIFDAADL